MHAERDSRSGTGSLDQNLHLVVSMTTTPSRIAAIGAALRSVLAQTLRPARVHLYVPETCCRTRERYVLPDWLTLRLPRLATRPPDAGNRLSADLALTKVREGEGAGAS